MTYNPFPRPLDIRMAPDGRSALLLDSFEFIDQQGKKWVAPKGVTVNGASIPHVFWSIVGSPWTGKYREASVVHDYYCVTRTEPWQAVHRLFYNAMVANGVNVLQAKIMYAAVFRFGPRWDFTYTPTCEGCLKVPHKVTSYQADPDPAELQQLKDKIQVENLTLEEIEREAEVSFQAAVRPLTLGRPARRQQPAKGSTQTT